MVVLGTTIHEFVQGMMSASADKLVDPRAKHEDDGYRKHGGHAFSPHGPLFSVRRKRETRGSPSSSTARLLA